MKKTVSLLLFICILMTFCACAVTGDNEREVVSRHYDSSTVQSYRVFKATDYSSLINDLYEIFDDGLETCTIRFMGYDGNVENDYHKALGEVINSAIGKYAVYEVGGKIEKIVTFYEVNLSASYKISTKKLSDMVFVTNVEDKKALSDDVLKGSFETLTVFYRPEYSDSTDMYDALWESFLRHPTDSVFIPIVDTHKVYEGDEGQGCVIAYTIEPRIEREKNESMLSELKLAVSDIVSSSKGQSAVEKLCDMLNILTANAKLSMSSTEEKNNVENTAYGGIIGNKATSIGYALSVKALCDGAGIGCTVVQGEKDGAKHYWNIVNVNGGYFHVDITGKITNGDYDYYLCSDADMSEHYSWDEYFYPQCGGESFLLTASAE